MEARQQLKGSSPNPHERLYELPTPSSIVGATACPCPGTDLSLPHGWLGDLPWHQQTTPAPPLDELPTPSSIVGATACPCPGAGWGTCPGSANDPSPPLDELPHHRP